MNYTYDENGNIIMLNDPSSNFEDLSDNSLLSSITPIKKILSISADQAITGLIRGMANVSPNAAQKRIDISSKEAKNTYFPYANNKSFSNDSFQVTEDIDSDLLQRIDTQKFFLDQFNNGLEDKGEYAFTVTLFVSRDGNKIKETYEVTKPEPNEFLLFLEDNTDDFSKQILRAKVGENIRERLSVSQLSQTSIFNYVNRHFKLSKQFLLELATKGYVEEDVSITGYIFKGVLYLLSAVMSPAKAVGWILNKVGDLVNVLTISDALWDTEGDNYIFKKENVINTLTMDTTFLDDWYNNLIDDKTRLEFNDVIPGFIIAKAQATILKIKEFITNYNLSVTSFIEGLSNTDVVSTLLENFSFMCGLWNGLVDFISSTLKFLGGILESGFDLATNFENTLETIDSFWDTLTNVKWADVWEGLGFLVTKIKEYFKSNKSEDYNWVRIAYISGFGIAFIATLFVPFTQVAKLSGFSKLKKLIPESAIKSIVDGVGTATAKVKTKSKEAYGTFLKNLEKIFAILGKGKAAVKKFFSDIWKRVSEWFLKNKKAFENIVDKVTLEIYKALAKVFKTKKIINATNGVEILCFVYRKGVIPVDKILKYARGKVTLVDNLPQLQNELRKLQTLKQTARKAFDKVSENQKRIEKLKKLIENADKSLNNSKALLNKVGYADDVRGNKKLFNYILAIANRDAKKIAKGGWHKSILKGPKGKATVLTQWQKLENGKLYLKTIKIF